MHDDTSLKNTALSTRAKRGLALENVNTVADLKRLFDEQGERYIRERMFNIGKVTAGEILTFLGLCRS